MVSRLLSKAWQARGRRCSSLPLKPRLEILEDRNLPSAITEFSIPTSDSQPNGLAAGPDGNVWFVESNANEVARITPTGTVAEFSTSTPNSRPVQITSGPDGNLWFTEFNANQVTRMTPAGVVTGNFPVPTANCWLFSIVAGPDGNLWFTEANAPKVGRITTGGTITEFALPGSVGSSYITVGQDGNLWATRQDTRAIDQITPSGIVTEFTPATTGSHNRGITSGPDGSLWFTENQAGLIARMNTSGILTGEFVAPTSNGDPVSITAGPDGNLWFTETDYYTHSQSKIARITTTGTITEFTVPTPNSDVEELTVGPDHSIWFTEYAANQIGMLNLNQSTSFTDHFEESSLDPFWSTTQNSGSITFPSTGQVYDGSQSVQLSSTQTGAGKRIALDHVFSTATYGNFSVWMYDTGAGVLSSNYIGMELVNSHDSTAYKSLGTHDYDLGPGQGGDTYYLGDGPQSISTGVDRTQAWHHLVIDVTPALATFQVDGATVYTTANPGPVDEIHLFMGGPSWRPAWTSYFDDFAFNAPKPTASLTGPTDGFKGVRSQVRTLTLDATDPSTADQAAGFTYALDWGDGTTQSLTGLSGIPASHAYSTAGDYTATLTVTDKDGDVSDLVSLPLHIGVTEQQGTTLAVGGTAASDNFDCTPGSVAGTVNVSINGVSQGTFTTGQVMVYGGDGTDAVTVNGTRGADTFSLTSTDVTVSGVAIAATDAESWTVNGGAGNDVFNINGSGLAARLSGGANSDTFKVADGVLFDGFIDGGTGVDNLVGSNADNQWNVTGSNAGNLNGSSFIGIENLTGGSGADTFHVLPAGEVSGRVNGQGGTNMLDYSSYGSPIVVDLQVRTAPGLDNFSGIQSLVGSGGADTLIGPDVNNTWLITSNDGGHSSGGNLTFAAIANLVGGAGNDAFRFSDGTGVSGTIDGGDGTNTVDYSACTTGVTADLSQGTATGVALGIANIQNATGGAGDDVLTGNRADNVLLGNAGNDTLSGGSGGNDILVGGAGNDTLLGGPGRSLLFAGSGADMVVGGADDDLVIGGTTSYDTNTTALRAVLNEWKRTDLTYQQRIDHLRGTTGGGMNGPYLLTAKKVKDDAIPDVLTGGLGLDWFWANLSEINDLAASEQVN